MSDFRPTLMEQRPCPTGRLTQRTPRRYYVGITSVLRRCVAPMCVAVMIAPTPVVSQGVEAQRLANLMAYCVSAIASNTVNVSNVPVGVKTGSRSARWNGGRDDALQLNQIQGDWECAISSKSPQAMARAAKGFLAGIKGAQVTEQKWRNGKSKAVLASACVGKKRITMVANGPIGEGGNFGFTRITDKFRKVRPC